MKKIIWSVTVVALLTLFLVGYSYVDSNRFEKKKQKFTIELGDDISREASDYVVANETLLKKTKVDISKVDNMKVGEYTATIKCEKKSVEVQIIVKDTVAPNVVLQENPPQMIVRKSVPLTSFVKDITDLAGIESVTVSDGLVITSAIDDLKANTLDTMFLEFSSAGEKEITLITTDKNKNKTEVQFKIDVVKDYEAAVVGLIDIKVEQNSEIDWMSSVIISDSIVKEVIVDAAEVDLATPGTYQLKYTIVGDDDKTRIDKIVTVTVVAPDQAQELANSGEPVKTTGGTKQAGYSSNGTAGTGKTYSGSVSGSSKNSGASGNGSSSSSGNSGSSRPSGNSNSGSSSGGSSSGGSSSGFNPGQSWGGDKTEEGYFGGGDGSSGENSFEGGTWNPWG